MVKVMNWVLLSGVKPLDVYRFLPPADLRLHPRQPPPILVQADHLLLGALHLILLPLRPCGSASQPGALPSRGHRVRSEDIFGQEEGVLLASSG